tara:strand:+ start:31663 stop:32424 length:762 start_codon:yes stop_codon:yes gene_type:complete
MKILIITQEDPFYLSTAISKLINKLPQSIKIVGCIVNNVSPFGKKESFLTKAFKTLRIFGIIFFIRYAVIFVINKFMKNSVSNVLSDNKIKKITLSESINSEDSLQLIKSYKPDLLISIASNEIFKKPLIDLAPQGCINLHSALLPKYRGLMPCFWVLKNNEEYTGVSVFYVDEGIDSGNIIVQKKIKINDMSLEKLIKTCKDVGIDAIIESINKIRINNFDVILNDNEKKTYFSFPTSDDVKIFKKLGKSFF